MHYALKFLMAALVHVSAFWWTVPAAAQADADSPANGEAAAGPLTILVSDPLAKQLACDCVAGFAQRRYEALAMVLEKRLDRPVNVLYATKLKPYWGEGQRVSLIIGKHSDVLYQARELGREVEPIAALTDQQGKTTFQGLFVVRSGNRATSLKDLQGYRVLFGPPAYDEKHAAAAEALGAAGIAVPDAPRRETAESCTDAANQLMKATDREAVAAVISDYAKVLLEGCHTIPVGSLRVIGQTAPLPFVTVFATSELDEPLRGRIQRELTAAKRFSALLRLLESKSGFRPIRPEQPESAQGWHDFRGAGRDGLVAELPAALDHMRTLWTAPLDGRGLGGIAVAGRWVAATDHVEANGTDYLKLFDAETGELRFSGDLVEPTGLFRDRQLDYGNSIRTTPRIHGGHVYLLDAFGALFRWRIPDGDQFTPSDCLTGMSTALLVDDYELITWGTSSTPLLATSSLGQPQLVVNLCSASNTLVALDPYDLTVRWKGSGPSTGYASCIVGTFGGRRQIVGYDSVALGGWDVDTGKRIWTVRPDHAGDFNVPTPVDLDDHRLLVVSESNGMRIYEFDESGVLRSRPVAVNDEIAHDTVSPIVVAGKAYCTSNGALAQVDLRDQLRLCWEMPDKAFTEHVSLLADQAARRLMVTTYRGEILLFSIDGDQPELIGRRYAYAPDQGEEIYAHPALVEGRLYLRGLRSLKCLTF